MTASDAKLNFGEVLNQCVFGDVDIIVTRHNKPLAVIQRYESWQQQQSSDAIPALHRDVLEFRQSIQNRLKKSGKKPTKSSVVELAKQARDELLKRGFGEQ